MKRLVDAVWGELDDHEGRSVSTGQPPRALRRSVQSVIVALWPLLLLWPAWHYQHPLLFSLRDLETGLWLAVACFTLWRWRRLPLLTRALLLALLLLVGVQETHWRLQRERVLAAGPTARAVGAHFIVGYTDFAEVAELAEKGLIGGIYVTRRNIRGRSFAEVRGEIAALQEKRRQAGLPPLIVAADQEGGPVNHLSPLLEPMPHLATLTEAADPGQMARRYGEAQGRTLAALGVTLNLAPVVDLKPPKRLENDHLSNIPARAIGSDPAAVTAIAAGYLDGLAIEGVRGALKHFPGLRRVTRDTHLESVRLDATPAAMTADWQPFRALAGHADSALMVGHVALAAIDGQRAASHSPAVVAMLRRDWAYNGPIITDDLNMGAVYDLGIAAVAAESLAAGVDLALVSYDPRQIYPALDGAAEALERGDITLERLTASEERIRGWKNQAGFSGSGASTSANSAAAVMVRSTEANCTAAPGPKGCSTHRPSAPLR
jgi:beta-N-acetylhexosaminidase